MNTHTAHTPGPWTADDEISSLSSTVSVYANGPIVYVKDNGAGPINQMANARLIAAAPELLEALREMLESDNVPSGCIDHGAIERKARAAIAKATGKDTQ